MLMSVCRKVRSLSHLVWSGGETQTEGLTRTQREIRADIVISPTGLAPHVYFNITLLYALSSGR